MRKVRYLIPAALLALFLTACASPVGQSKAPALASAYGSLEAHWQAVAGAMSVPPDQAHLRDWNMSYGEGGAIRYFHFKVYVARGPDSYDAYSFSQEAGGKTIWHRDRVKGALPAAVVPASEAFAAMDAVGFQALEQHQQLTPPVMNWFWADYGPKHYRRPAAGGYLVKDGVIEEMGPDGARVEVRHGWFGIKADAGNAGGQKATASTADPTGPLFVIMIEP